MADKKPKSKRRLFILASISAITFLCILCGLIGSLGDRDAPAVTELAQQVEEISPTEVLASPTSTLTVTPPATPTLTTIPTNTPTPSPETLASVLEVHFIDVGQGDAILLVLGEYAALIDGGDRGSGVVAYLQRQGITYLDLVIASHPHADHIGGLIDVIRAITVDRVITNGQMHTTLTYERFLDAIIDSGAEYFEVRRGDTIPFGSLVIDVLHPLTPVGQNLNEQSLVLRLKHGNVTFLFTGDAEKGAEQSMLAWGGDLQAKVLKVAHHGSRSSSTPAFLDKVQPEIAVYCAGLGNQYGHPHEETLVALTQIGAEIYGTDIHGSVVIISDGKSYQVETEHPGVIFTIPAAIVTITPAPTQEATTEGCAYIGNRNTKVFHRPTCSSVKQMAEHNKVCLSSREEAIERGFRPCQRCNP
jgi:competence protein ComEC